MLRCLNPGHIHVTVDSLENMIDFCRIGGFDCIALSPKIVSEMPADEFKAEMFESHVAPGAWGLPVNWRGSEDDFKASLADFPAQCALMQAVGVTRCATWIMPGSNDMDTAEYRKLHIDRLTPVAKVLADHGMSFGMEFIGPKTLRDALKYPFIYKMEDMLDLGAEMGDNVGLLVDAFHLYTSGGQMSDLAKVPAEKIVLVHINDAKEGRTADEQIDGERELPCTTGVIPIGEFMAALRSTGYQGPVEAEPFDASLKSLGNDSDRVRKTGEAVSRAFRA
ncbi:MAG TPA: sugar phosphate isomerase/epimerase family protein [Fimbriimonas sp.]|nr:sugar phosphate isomerase/epimerase family protein [Fimbriimonas sp.]